MPPLALRGADTQLDQNPVPLLHKTGLRNRGPASARLAIHQVSASPDEIFDSYS